MIYKTLKKVSDVCQVLDKSKYNPSQTKNGVTFTNNGDESIIVNGTATADVDYRGISNNAKLNVVAGHKYLMRGCPAGGSKDTYDLRLPFLGFDYGNGLIAKLTDNGAAYYYMQIIVRAGIVCDNLIFKPQLFDLTEMYGAGNEPTTVEQFRQDFPDEMYDYKPYCFVKSYKTLLKATDDKIITSYKKSLACKTKNLFDKIGAALIRTDGSAASVNLYSWKGSKIYINYGLYAGGLYFQPITLSAGTYTLSAMASMNNINGSDRYVSIGYKDNSNNLHSQYVNISSDNQKISYTFTLTEETIICINLQGIGNSSNSSNLDTSFWDIQLELGDTATDYVPYGYL